LVCVVDCWISYWIHPAICQTAAGTAGTVCLDKKLGSCQASEQLSQLRDIATVMFLEAVQKNYGKAGEYSKEFFDQAQRIQSSTEDPALRNLLRDTLATRDQITADLAKGDAAALSEMQPLLSKIEQTAKH
jgi:hypothetical protein